jgi:hypothetical protein
MAGRKLSTKDKDVRRRMQRKISNAEKKLAGMSDKNSIQATRLKKNIRTWDEAVDATYVYDRHTGKKRNDYNPAKRQAAFENLREIESSASSFASPAQNARLTKTTQIELNKASIGAPSKYSKAQSQIVYQRSKYLWQGAPSVEERNEWIVKKGGFNNLQEAVDYFLEGTPEELVKARDIINHAKDKDENGNPLYTEEEIQKARRLLIDNADEYQVSPPDSGNGKNVPDKVSSSL